MTCRHQVGSTNDSPALVTLLLSALPFPGSRLGSSPFSPPIVAFLFVLIAPTLCYTCHVQLLEL